MRVIASMWLFVRLLFIALAVGAVLGLAVSDGLLSRFDADGSPDPANPIADSPVC